MTTSYILRLYPWTPRHTWRVVLDCGHKYNLTMAEINQQQLFAGKRVTCEARSPPENHTA